MTPTHQGPACALVGVVLIARPEFLFHQDPRDGVIPLPNNATRAMGVVGAGLDVTPEQRLAAVGYVASIEIKYKMWH